MDDIHGPTPSHQRAYISPIYLRNPGSRTPRGLPEPPLVGIPSLASAEASQTAWHLSCARCPRSNPSYKTVMHNANREGRAQQGQATCLKPPVTIPFLVFGRPCPSDGTSIAPPFAIASFPAALRRRLLHRLILNLPCIGTITRVARLPTSTAGYSYLIVSPSTAHYIFPTL